MKTPPLATTNANRKRVRAGFTLIELLVVIAIIAILAAILFPVFAQARAKARAAVCLSNQKQISMGFMMYAQDADETFPWVRSLCTGANANDFTQLLSPYIMNAYGTEAQKQAALWKCPSDATERDSPNFGVAKGPNSYAAVISYSEDDRAAAFHWSEPCTGGANGSIVPGRQLAAFKAPAATILLAEKPAANNLVGQNESVVGCPHGTGDIGCIGQDCSTGGLTFGVCAAQNLVKPLHNEGWNYLFADGHVKWYRPEATVDSNSGDAYVGTVGSPRGFWTLKDDD